MSRKYVATIVFLMIFVIFGGFVEAQETGDYTVLVDRALSHIGNNCANMGLNTVCYGHSDLSAVFTDDSTLNKPAERAELLRLASLQTMPFDLANETWGISVLNVQANLPNTLPGQAVKLVLLGDVYIEDETEQDQSLIYLEEAIAVEVQTDAGVFAAPIDFGVPSLSIVGHVSAGETLEADGLSSTGEWVRVTFAFETERGQSATAWVRREDLVANVELDTLPVIGPGSYTPMQAFYFSTGVGQPEYEELPPSSILVQGPEDYEVTIRANGADINISSTILLQTSSNSDMMRLNTISGFARVNPNSPEELIIPAGYSATVCLDGPYNLGVADNENDYVVGVGCDWSLAGGMTQEYLDSLQSLNQIPGNLLNYEIVVPQQVCASGIGGVVCQYRYGNQHYSDELAALCADGLIDPEICQAVVPGMVVSGLAEECQEVVEQVYASTQNNCANLGWNRVCYGYQGMVASFSSAEGLLQPADRASAVNFVAATNEGFDELLDHWGIFVMNTRANLPNTFTDGSVYSVFFGDGQIENHVATNAVLILPEEPVTVVVAAESAELFMAPDTFVLEDHSTVGEVKAGDTLKAEAITEGGGWVRVVFEYETDFGHILTAWIPREALVENAAIDDLPVIKLDSYTPMQSISFTTSAAVPQCGEAAVSAQMAYLIVQGPTDTEIRQTINGADMRINGMILVQAFPARRLIRVTTLSGIVRVQPGSGDELLIPAGYSAITCMDGPFNLGADGLQNEYLAGNNCDWHMSGRLTEDAIAAFGADRIPDDLFNYPVYLPALVCDEQGCDYQDTNPAYAERLAHLCAEGYLSESICRFILD